LIEPELGGRVPARELLTDLVAICRPHAKALGCEPALDDVIRLGERTGAQRQLEQAAALGSLPRLVGLLAADFV
jgi:gamma-glutamyl:cysteine ligase YbdK (ATP-grasp superfamily)